MPFFIPCHFSSVIKKLKTFFLSVCTQEETFEECPMRHMKRYSLKSFYNGCIKIFFQISLISLLSQSYHQSILYFQIQCEVSSVLVMIMDFDWSFNIFVLCYLTLKLV